MSKYTVIVIDNEKNDVVINDQWENLTFAWENGMEIGRQYKMDGDPVIESNGQRRLIMKAWEGCPTYETFKTDAGSNQGEVNAAG